MFVKKLKTISDTGIEENIEIAKPEATGMLGWALGSIKKVTFISNTTNLSRYMIPIQQALHKNWINHKLPQAHHQKQNQP